MLTTHAHAQVQGFGPEKCQVLASPVNVIVKIIVMSNQITWVVVKSGWVVDGVNHHDKCSVGRTLIY